MKNACFFGNKNHSHLFLFRVLEKVHLYLIDIFAVILLTFHFKIKLKFHHLDFIFKISIEFVKKKCKNELYS